MPFFFTASSADQSEQSALGHGPTFQLPGINAGVEVLARSKATQPSSCQLVWFVSTGRQQRRGNERDGGGGEGWAAEKKKRN